MNIGDAIREVTMGNRVRRAAWVREEKRHHANAMVYETDSSAVSRSHYTENPKTLAYSYHYYDRIMVIEWEATSADLLADDWETIPVQV